MSRRVRAWLTRLMIVTTHEQRVEIDREIERRKHMHCDSAIERNLVSKAEFLEIINLIKSRKKKKKEEIAYVV